MTTATDTPRPRPADAQQRDAKRAEAMRAHLAVEAGTLDAYTVERTDSGRLIVKPWRRAA